MARGRAAGCLRPNERRRGFSLLEVMLSCLLVATVFLTVAELYPLAAASLNRGKRLSTASNLAQDTLEKARLTPFSSLTASRVTETVDGREYVVVTDLSTVSPKVLAISVTVSCTDVSVTYGTCVYDYVNPP